MTLNEIGLKNVALFIHSFFSRPVCVLFSRPVCVQLTTNMKIADDDVAAKTEQIQQLQQRIQQQQQQLAALETNCSWQVHACQQRVAVLTTDLNAATTSLQNLESTHGACAQREKMLQSQIDDLVSKHDALVVSAAQQAAAAESQWRRWEREKSDLEGLVASKERALVDALSKAEKVHGLEAEVAKLKRQAQAAVTEGRASQTKLEELQRTFEWQMRSAEMSLVRGPGLNIYVHTYAHVYVIQMGAIDIIHTDTDIFKYCVHNS